MTLWDDRPDLLTAQRILCIAPHPDDNELGAGGTICRLAEQGTEVTFLVVTDGSAGTNDPDMTATELVQRRREEQEAACKTLQGAVRIDLDWLNYPDAAGLPAVELRDRLILEIRKVKPDYIFTVDPWLPYEGHPDHRQVGMAATEAFLFSGLPHVGPKLSADAPIHRAKAIAYYATSAPNEFINVDKTWAKKRQSIAAHNSQFSGDLLTMLMDRLEELSAVAARRAPKPEQPCDLAEPFRVMDQFQLHMNTDLRIS